MEFTGAEAVDLVIAEGRQPALIHPFKGNMDVAALEALLDRARSDDVPVVVVTITNNSGGGQPVSLANLRAVREVCDRFGKPLFLDGCRFAENAWFIKTREPGQADRPVIDIIREIGGLADGMTMSAKKDGMANIGGWLAMNDDALAEQCRNLPDPDRGLPDLRRPGRPGPRGDRPGPPGGRGRGLPALPDHAPRRTSAMRWTRPGSRCVQPFGGHAVYLDARALLPHIPPLEYPGQALAVELYRAGGIRGCEIGTVMFGLHPDGTETPAAMDLVRLAIPRRTYTQSHIDYVIEVAKDVASRASSLRGLPDREAARRAPALHGDVRAAGPVGDTNRCPCPTWQGRPAS